MSMYLCFHVSVYSRVWVCMHVCVEARGGVHQERSTSFKIEILKKKMLICVCLLVGLCT